MVILIFALFLIVALFLSYLNFTLFYKVDDESGLETLRKVMTNVSKNEYKLGTFDCDNFSRLFVDEMRKQGFYANIVLGKVPNMSDNEYHAWVEIWIEPQTGKLVRIDDKYIEDVDYTLRKRK